MNTPSHSSDLWKGVNSFFTGLKIPDDVAEQQFKAQISQSNHDEKTFLKHLLRDYRRLKNTPGFLIINPIFQSWTIMEDLRNGGVQSNCFH